MSAMLTGPQWPAEWRAVLCVGAVVRVSRDERDHRAAFDDTLNRVTFDALVTFVGVGGVCVRRGAKGRGRRDVVAYDDLRGYTLPVALPSSAAGRS